MNYDRNTSAHKAAGDKFESFLHWMRAAYAPQASRGAPMSSFRDRMMIRFAQAWITLDMPRVAALLEAVRATDGGVWAGTGFRETRARWTGHRLRLDCEDFYQRLSYYYRSYHETWLLQLMRRALRSGDSFLDGGANIGLVTLIASWIVGSRGRVVAVEPNPPVYAQLKWHVDTNRLANVQALPVGIGDQPAELTIRSPDAGNTGAGTFCALPARYGDQVADSSVVKVVTGDSLGLDRGPGELMIKLDVEGFEYRALRGLEGTIKARSPMVIAEINPEMLGMDGHAIPELFELMGRHGYEPYGFVDGRTLWRRNRLAMWPVSPHGALPHDVAWIKRGSPFFARLAPYMRKAEG